MPSCKLDRRFRFTQICATFLKSFRVKFMKSESQRWCLGMVTAAAGVLLVNSAAADPTHYLYGGDLQPSEGPYAAWFTTLGPGHPTGSYFLGTTWISDGNALTMYTQHPNDFSGATSQGIWFGRTDGYGDPSSFSLSPTSAGNHVDARLALGANSSEWSLYWYDTSGYGCGFYFLNNGFYFGSFPFHALADMTSFHTFGSHIYNGQAYYYLDGALLGSEPAASSISNFLLLGDGSAGDLSGYGSLRVDYLDIVTDAGPAVVPEPGVVAFSGLGLLWLGGRALRARTSRG